MAFATTGDLSSLLEIDFDVAEAARAQLLLDLVSGEVKTFCDVAFEQTSRTIELAGTWSARLELPGPPVTSVSTVTLDGDSVTDYRLVRGVLVRDSHWGGPNRVVTVTYTHGLTAVPDTVRAVVLRASARAWANPEQRESVQLESGYQARFTAQAEDKDTTFLTAGDMRALVNAGYRRTAT